jgi:hypothetical protein
MRALLGVIAVACVLVACSDPPTDPVAVGSGPSYVLEGFCPAPFTQSSIIIGSGAGAADNNGDGVACYLDVMDPQDETAVHRTWVDNNVPIQLGVCPGNFELVSAKQGEGADRNADGFACQATRPNGNVVVVDNRFDVEKGGGELPPAEEETPPGK